MSEKKRVFKLKKPAEVVEVSPVPQAEVPLPAKKKVFKIKKAPLEAPVAPVVVPVAPVVVPVAPLEAPIALVKKVIKLNKNLLPMPPIPSPSMYITKAMEAFEAIREYHAVNGEEPTQSDIKWYLAELEAEKKENDALWLENKVLKAIIDATNEGKDLEGIMMAEAAAMANEKPRPLTEIDLGPMPTHGTKDFWAWCMKRKQIRLAKEAAIIAAGGTIPPPKVKKPKKVKDTENTT